MISEDEPGIWLPPISAKQIGSALAFGRRTYGTIDSPLLENDPYDRFLDNLGVLVSIGTVFNRLAAYAGQCSRTVQQVDPAMIETVNLMTPFDTHFAVRMMSKFKVVSIVLQGPDGEQQPLEDVTREQGDGGTFKIMGWFRCPEQLKSTLSFEVGVPHFTRFLKK